MFSKTVYSMLKCWLSFKINALKYYDLINSHVVFCVSQTLVFLNLTQENDPTELHVLESFYEMQSA